MESSIITITKNVKSPAKSGRKVEFMGVVLILLIIGYGIYKIYDYTKWNTSYPGELDVKTMSSDRSKVSCGTLSQSEFRRRCRDGYYKK